MRKNFRHHLSLSFLSEELFPSKCHACCCLVAKSCPTLCDPMDCSPARVLHLAHGIFQARILEWVAISFSRGSFRDQTSVSCLAGGFLTTEPPGKPLRCIWGYTSGRSIYHLTVWCFYPELLQFRVLFVLHNS